MPINPYPVGQATRNAAEIARPKAVLQGLQQKQRIINQVIDGRLPLWDAATEFQAAHRAAGVCLERATGVPGHAIAAEDACRTIIGGVHLTLSDRPEQADRVSERLESELRDHLQRTNQLVPPR